MNNSTFYNRPNAKVIPAAAIATMLISLKSSRYVFSTSMVSCGSTAAKSSLL